MMPLFDKLTSLDEFLTPNYLRPFYLAMMAVTLLAGLGGILSSLSLMTIAPMSGLIGLVMAVAWVIVGLFMTRLGFEAFIALFRLHARFVGGHPRDRIPD